MLTLLTGISKRRGLASGLVGHWRMDESSGTTAADSSPSGINGTLSGGAAFASGGRIARCLDLEGTGKCTLSDPYSALMTNADKTIALWAYKETAVNGQEHRMAGLFRGLTGANGLTTFAITSGNSPQVMRFRYYTGSAAAEIGNSVSAASLLNNWHHFAFVQEGTAVRAYIDGSQIASANNAGTATVSSPPNAVIGGYNVSSEFFTGLIDDVRFYDRALSADEIAALVAIGIG